MPEVTIGIDLGGTRIKAVAIDEAGHILHQYYHPTNDGRDPMWKMAIAEAVGELQIKAGTNNTIIGISAPGLPNDDNTAIASMPGRLQGLENLVWTEFLQSKTIVLNDCMAALVAEARFGVAKNKRNVVMLTLGTGVGGAIMIDGRPYQGSYNKAGHIGHMVIDSDGEPDITGMPGSLEEAIGNCSMEKRSSGRFSSTKQMLEAYKNGDGFAAEIWLTSVKKLALGLATLTNILSPEVIILGGGISKAGEELFEPLEKFMSEYEWRTRGNKCEIIPARFGDLAGAVGAACFAREYGTKK